VPAKAEPLGGHRQWLADAAGFWRGLGLIARLEPLHPFDGEPS
jgi:hypothetical protein